MCGQHNRNKARHFTWPYAFHRSLYVKVGMLYAHYQCALDHATQTHMIPFVAICQRWHTRYIRRPQTKPYVAQLTHKSVVPSSKQVCQTGLRYFSTQRTAQHQEGRGGGGGGWQKRVISNTDYLCSLAYQILCLTNRGRFNSMDKNTHRNGETEDSVMHLDYELPLTKSITKLLLQMACHTLGPMDHTD